MSWERRTRAARSARRRRRGPPARARAPRTTRARARTSPRRWTRTTPPLVAPPRTSRRGCAGSRTPRPPGRLFVRDTRHDRTGQDNRQRSRAVFLTGGVGKGRTVHLDAALPLVLLLEVRARLRLRVPAARGCWGGGGRGAWRGGRAPRGGQEVDVEVRAERERRGLVLVRAVRGVREQLHDRQRQVVWGRQDVRCFRREWSANTRWGGVGGWVG